MARRFRTSKRVASYAGRKLQVVMDEAQGQYLQPRYKTVGNSARCQDVGHDGRHLDIYVIEKFAECATPALQL